MVAHRSTLLASDRTINGTLPRRHARRTYWMVLGVVERLKPGQYLRNLRASVVYLPGQLQRDLSRRSKTFCVGPGANPHRFLAGFADFLVRPAQKSDGSSFWGPVRNALRFRNIAGWAVLPVASGKGA
jgi:hypothetical protein